ncbi:MULTISPECIES: AAA family ATPase [unclassified Pseudomonas]|uniref:AAA family ATPase n=1 Tax=unclassified Pseudomonas TaxID=196821 RepID=UPI00244A7E59|nr:MULTISPECIES: AAA family ATPase [unclassified Pseudomonas]MDH0302264.1 AAA family ATPase [Pseudomonas sp. GD04091]MDH1986005.1 AAA family ATPase [Pseudomonas sp. GD03689]
MKRLLLLSGPMASGKTSVSECLKAHHGFEAISSGSFLRAQLAARDEPNDRHNLQELGDALDSATDFSWLIESVARPAIDARPNTESWLLDAVRKARQVELFRLHFRNAVRHVHVTAPESVLQRRYAERGADQLALYQSSVNHPNEQSARSLECIADKVVNTEELNLFDIANQILELWEH